jgi:hypothetical protein
MSDIETAKPCDGLVDQRAHVILLADVGVDMCTIADIDLPLFTSA